MFMCVSVCLCGGVGCVCVSTCVSIFCLSIPAHSTFTLLLETKAYGYVCELYLSFYLSVHPTVTGADPGFS